MEWPTNQAGCTSDVQSTLEYSVESVQTVLNWFAFALFCMFFSSCSNADRNYLHSAYTSASSSSSSIKNRRRLPYRMHGDNNAAFSTLKPCCVDLSLIALKRPNECLPQLLRLQKAIAGIDPNHISQNLGNYVFFPIKGLLKLETTESVITAVFGVLKWLIQTQWFNPDMVSQLTILHGAFLSRAKSEDLKLEISNSCQILFHMAGPDMNSVPGPSLAHLFTLLLPQNSISITIQNFASLRELCRNVDGDVAASFLPGCVSSLSRTLLHPNQRSGILVCGLELLEEHICKSLDGSTEMRSDTWRARTQEKLQEALSLILTAMITNEYATVITATRSLCQRLLTTSLDPKIYVECLLQIAPDDLSSDHDSVVASVLDGYVDAAVKVLQGVDEQRKLSMIQTLMAMDKLPTSSRELLSEKLVNQIISFVQFSNTKVQALEDSLREPTIEYLSDQSRDALGKLLGLCRVDIAITSPETFWIAQKLGISTYEHAMTQLTAQPDLSQQSVISEARRLGRDYRPDLMHSLYPLLALPQPSLYTLAEIAKACEYVDVQEMVIDNADYIINSLSLAFVTLNIAPRTPKILGVLVQLAPNMVELIEDVVDSYFDVLDSYHGYSGIVEGIFSGLSGVVKAVAKQEPKSAFIEGVSNLEGAEIVKEKEQPDAKSYTSVLHIVQKAQLFLSHGDPQIRMLVLALMLDAIPVVAINENKFLPLVHLYWPQLTRRLDDPNAYVAAAVLQVMAKTITFAGSFMRLRYKDDVVPAIDEILHPAKDKRGNLMKPRKEWEGTGRRKVAEGIQSVLKAAVEDAGLRGEECKHTLGIVEELSTKSDVMKQVLSVAHELDSS